MPPRADELDLVARANRGDAAAFDTLYRSHRDWVIGVARQITGNDADAVDVLQEVFIYWFEKFPGFRLTATVRGFLFPVVRNKSISLIRKRKKVVAIEEARESHLPVVWPDTGDFGRIVDQLPDPQREVVVLRFAMQLKLEEIAETLDIPKGTVKSRLHNALARLREKLDPSTGDPSTGSDPVDGNS